MVKENKILAIDIGGENLKMAEFRYPENGGMTLEIFAFRKMVRIEGESSGEMFSRYYNELLTEYGFTANSVRVSLSAQNSFQRLSKLPAVLGNKDNVDRMVEYEASQTVPYPIDEIEWGYQLLFHEWEEMVAEEQEDGSVQEVSVKREENVHFSSPCEAMMWWHIPILSRLPAKRFCPWMLRRWHFSTPRLPPR